MTGGKVAPGQISSSTSSALSTPNTNNYIILHDILQAEFQNPPVNPEMTRSPNCQRQYDMETESFYDDLLDHNNHSLPSPPQLSAREPSPPPIIPPQMSFHNNTILRKRRDSNAIPPTPILPPPMRFRNNTILQKKNTKVVPPPTVAYTKHHNMGTQMSHDI